MLVLIFILPLITALACLALNQLAPTRWLGLAASAALLICGLALLLARLRGQLPLALIDVAWLAIDARPLQLTLQFDALSWAPALLALLGGGIALLVLALAVPLHLRGFGGLFAAAELMIIATVAGLANQAPLLLPFAWALAALLAFLALRASGALAGSDAPVIVLLAGLSGALLALASGLLAGLNDPGLAQAVLACTLLLGLLALGAPPFHSPLQQLAEAPSALAGMLLALGLPLLGGITLIRFLANPAVLLPAGWRLAVTLLGLVMLLGCAAGAMRTTRLRQILSWQFSAQLGLVLVAAAQGGAAVTVAAPALLVNSALSTLVCYLAVAILERRAGTDDLAEIAPRATLAGAGALFSVGAASAIGLPGFWGFWPRRWLLDALLGAAPWAVAPLLAGSTLLALAFVPALAVFLRRDSAPAIDQSAAPARERSAVIVLAGAVAALPLLIFGVAPGRAWSGWLAELQLAPAVAPALPGWAAQIACGIGALLLIGLALALPSRRSAATAPAQSGAVAPAALGQSLGGLAELALASAVFAGVWGSLLRGSRLLLRGLVLFERRYYLAGLLIAVIVVVMLFIQ